MLSGRSDAEIHVPLVPPSRERLVKNDAVAIDDRRRRRVDVILGDRTNSRTGKIPSAAIDPQQATGHRPLELHGLTSPTTLVAVRPNTSGSYISSACAGAVMNVPGRRRAQQVRELVHAFAEPRREQVDAIVVALDVIEAAALPPTSSRSCPDCRFAASPRFRWPSSRTTTRPARCRRESDR